MRKITVLCLLLIFSSIALWAESPSAVIKKGEEFIKKGDRQKGIQEFRRAIVIDPKAKTAEQDQFLIGIYTEDVYSRIMEFKTLIKEYPKSEFREEVQIELGKLYYLLDKYKESEQYYSEYIKIYTEKGRYASEAFYWLGQIALIEKKYDQAITYFSKVINNYPHSDFLLFAKLQIALTYIKTGKYMEARQILEKIWLLNDDFKGLIDEYLDLIPESDTETVSEDKVMYGIQCGAFSKRENAFNYKAELEKKNYGTVFVVKDGNLYKVIIGYYESLEETNKLSREISEKEKIRATIVRKR